MQGRITWSGKVCLPDHVVLPDSLLSRNYSFADKQERTAGRSKVVRKFPYGNFLPPKVKKSCAILARLLGRAAPIHAPAFLAFAMQMLLNTRYCAKRAKLLFSAFEQTEGCLYAANSLEATPHN
jgi:hypothetical protein